MNFVYSLLLASSLVLIQCLIGGTRLVYSFPAYAIAGVAASLTLFSLRRPISKPSTRCMATTLLFGGYIFVRAWFSPNAFLAQADAYLSAACLIVYLLTALYLTESRYRNWVAAALFAMAAVHITVGLIQFKNGEGFMLFGFNRGETYAHRASGQLICPNHLAGYLEALALMALGFTLWCRSRVSTKLLTGYMVLFCLMGLAVTGSRGGYLSFTFGLLTFTGLSLWIVRLYKTQRFTLSLLVAVGIITLLLGSSLGLMMNSKPIRTRLQKIGTASEDIRWYNWLAAVDQLKLSPTIGTGSGTHLYYGRLFRRIQLQNDPQHAHGDYLELLAEYGLVGGTLAALFLISHISTGLKTVRKITLTRLCNSFGPARSDTLALTVGALSAIAALLAHSVVDFNMHIPGNALFFAFLFGILANPGTEIPGKKVSTIPLGLLRMGLVAAGIGMVYFTITRYPAERFNNLARLAMGSGEYEECIRWAKLALEKDSSNPNTYFYQGEAYRALATGMPSFASKEHYFEQAIESYRAGLTYFPENENLWVRLGQSLDGIYQFSDAEEAYLAAIQTDPSLGILYSYYAAHLRRTGQLDAAEVCEKASRSMGSKKLEEIPTEDSLNLHRDYFKENDGTL